MNKIALTEQLIMPGTFDGNRIGKLRLIGCSTVGWDPAIKHSWSVPNKTYAKNQ